MDEIPEFFFDFDAIKGLPYEKGFQALFLQLQTHYNTYINKKPTFVFGADPGSPSGDFGAMVVGEKNEDGSVTVKDVKTVDADPNAVPVVEPNQGGRMKPKDFKADTQTVTPKTIPLATVNIVAGDDGVVLTGKADDGTEISDILLPGYETAPYGPVVSGRRGRYNLKREVE